MNILDFNAALANVIGLTGFGIFLCAWLHETYTDWMWDRREEEYRKRMDEERKLQSRRVFADNCVTFPEVDR